MIVKVVLLHAAESDLRELRDYMHTRFGDGDWKQCKARIKRSLARIATHPRTGAPPDELLALQLTQYRQVLSGMNRIIYELRDDMAYVHVICDARRDLQTLLAWRLLGD